MSHFSHHADHVGSLLRPTRLADARQAWRDGSLPRDELTTIEDECVVELVAHQQSLGIPRRNSPSVTADPPQRADLRRPFTFLAAAVTVGIPKITIPGPGMVSFMGGRASIDIDAYPDMDEYWADLVQAYRDEVDELYSAGCRYLQLDDVSFAYLCDPDFREQMRARGDDPDQMIIRHRDAMNAVIAGRPDDLVVS